MSEVTGGSVTIKQAANLIGESLKAGHHHMEAGYPTVNPLNERSGLLVEAYRNEHGEAWLGKINLYENDRGKPVMWQWDGSPVSAFVAVFVAPRYDAELVQMVTERDAAPYTGTRDDSVLVDRIFERLDAIGARSLIWN